GGVRVMPLGDSITDGFNVPGGYRVDLWQRMVRSARTGQPDPRQPVLAVPAVTAVAAPAAFPAAAALAVLLCDAFHHIDT
ncbi:hypothetical protein AB0C32_40560, partial [Streptosporangium sp. NPDC048865]